MDSIDDNYTLNKTILIGVSACLLGEKTRYDGGHKKSKLIIRTICSTFRCVSFCPEMAIGLGIPRNPITLNLDSNNNVHATMLGNNDVTQRLQHYASDIKTELASLSGFVLKSKSPSCGYQSAKPRSHDNREIRKTDGIFTAELRKYFPSLPICEESDLYNDEKIRLFIVKVVAYQQSKN